MNPSSPLLRSAFLLAFTVPALKAAITKTSIAPWTTSRMGQPGLWRRPLQGSSRCYRSTGGGRDVVGRSAWTYVQRSRTSRGLGSRRENGHASSHFFLSPILPRPLSSLGSRLLGSFFPFFSSLSRERDRLIKNIFISLGFQDLWKSIRNLVARLIFGSDRVRDLDSGKI